MCLPCISGVKCQKSRVTPKALQCSAEPPKGPRPQVAVVKINSRGWKNTDWMNLVLDKGGCLEEFKQSPCGGANPCPLLPSHRISRSFSNMSKQRPLVECRLKWKKASVSHSSVGCTEFNTRRLLPGKPPSDKEVSESSVMYYVCMYISHSHIFGEASHFDEGCPPPQDLGANLVQVWVLQWGGTSADPPQRGGFWGVLMHPGVHKGHFQVIIVAFVLE